MFPTRRITTLGGSKFNNDYGIDCNVSAETGDIEVADHSSLDFTDNFSSICWLKVRDVTETWSGVYAKIASGTAPYKLWIGPSGTLRFELDEAGSSRADWTSIANNIWYHVGITYSKAASAVKMYINGTEVASTSYATTITPTTGVLKIAIAEGSGHDWIGSIDDLAFYNITLTANDIQTAYNGREPFDHNSWSNKSGLAAYYRMGDGLENGSGTTLYDMSNNSNNGTISGDIAFSGNVHN